MKRSEESGIDVFNRDIAANEGYLYIKTAKLSSCLANRRGTDAVLASVDWRGKRVIDFGCGDGAFTLEIYDSGHPRAIVGVDRADEAVKLARRKVGDRAITFETLNACDLPFDNDSFDIAHLRAVLHHMDRPFEALREALRVAPVVVVMEPNGYSPVLKYNERFSRYHVEHGEKSYSPAKLKRWVAECGGAVQRHMYVGLVPMFFPDFPSKILKRIEPVVESIPLINAVACALYVFVAVRPSPRVVSPTDEKQAASGNERS
jgi:SAM-dependent methyltransferase